MTKIVCAFDSFKGCMTSRQAGMAARQGILQNIPDAMVMVVPCADGGEGMAQAVNEAGIGEIIPIKTVNSLGQTITSTYVYDTNSNTAYIDFAAASGLTLIAPDKRNPELTSSYGTGLMLRQVIDSGAHTIVLGLGGSATNDAALGLLQALGAIFRDFNGEIYASPICGKDLINVGSVDLSSLNKLLADVKIILLCDVDNPFLGPCGAVNIFAPQKGADTAMCQRLEMGMKNIVKLIKNSVGIDISILKSSGAAGGAAGALTALANAEIRPGAMTLLTMLRFDKTIQGADLILTGEGCSDSQTLHGKLPSAVLQYARQAHIPCALLSGQISDSDVLRTAGFSIVRSINTPVANSEIFALHHDCMNPHIAQSRLRLTASTVISDA